MIIMLLKKVLFATTVISMMGVAHAYTTVDQDGIDILPNEDDLSFYADLIRNTKYR